MTPELFNAFVNGEIKRKKANGTFKKGDAEGAEIRFDGQDTVFRISVADQEKGGFFNVELHGDPNIENGKFKGRVDSVKLANREAPWLARIFFDMAVEAARKGDLKNDKSPNKEENALEAIKLMKREGEKIHVIVDGSKVPKPDDQ